MSPPDERPQLPLQDSSLGSRHVLLVQGVGDGIAHRLRRPHVPASLTQPPEQGVDGDAVDPGRESAVVPERVELGSNRQEGVLHGILGKRLEVVIERPAPAAKIGAETVKDALPDHRPRLIAVSAKGDRPVEVAHSDSGKRVMSGGAAELNHTVVDAVVKLRRSPPHSP